MRGLAFAFGAAAAAFVGTKLSAVQSTPADPRWWGLAAPWLALYVMDRLCYHELLRAAVRFAMDIEAAHEAPPLCTALTRSNRATRYGRVKVSLFYWLPLAGFCYIVVGGVVPWVVTALPFVGTEVFAFIAHKVVAKG